MENFNARATDWPSDDVLRLGNASTNSGIPQHEAVSVLTKTWNEKYMTKARLVVSVIDDDESVRESLPDLLKELGFAARTFSSAEAFLASGTSFETACLLLDVAMPGMSGPNLQLELKRRGMNVPVIFITARRDEAMRKRVFEQGAAGFLLKPFSDTVLLDALNTALGVE